MYAVGARHGMSPHNRKFHWNSLEEYFDPVYYDGDIVIDQAIDQIKIFWAFMKEILFSLRKEV